eukprot:365849_1
MNATFNESEGASNQPNVPVLEPMNPSVIEMNHNKNNAMGPYAPNAYTATNTTAQEDSLSITCRKKDFRKCTTIVQWILIYYSVAAVSYLLISNSNQPICSCSGVVQRRNNGYDWNDQTFAYWTTIDSPASTERITYGLMMGMETGGSGDVRIGESFGSFADYDPRWPWSMPVVITAMEIRNGD